MTATAPAPAAPSTPAADPAAELVKRIDRLERQVSTLRRRVRRYERESLPFELTPEMAAEIDRREAEVLSGNFVGIPWEEVEANIRAKLKLK